MHSTAGEFKLSAGRTGLTQRPTFVEASRVFAGRILRQGGATDQDRLKFAFREATLRAMDPTEQHLLEELLKQSRSYYDEHPPSAQKLLGTGYAPVAPELDKRELAAWTIVVRALLNTSEVFTRQ